MTAIQRPSTGPRSPGSARRRTRLLLLALVLGLAALPRLADLGHPSLTYDEHYDVADSLRFCQGGRLSEPISDGYLNGQLPFLAACPLYRLLGPDERAARVLSAVAGLGTVLATWLVGRRVLGRRLGLLAALLVAVSPFAVSSARLAFSHGHGFHVPLVLFGLYAASRAAPRRGRTLWPGLAGLGLGLATGSDLLAAFWGPALLVLLGHRLRRTPASARARAALVFAGAALLGLAAASPMLVFHPGAAVRDVAERLSRWDAVADHLWLGRRVAALPYSYYAVVAAAKIAPGALLALLPALAHALGRGGARPRFLLLALWPVAYLTLKPWKSPYYLAAFVPVLYLLAAHGLGRAFRRPPLAGRRWLRAAAAALLVLPEAARGIAVHPDYLMLGIDYGENLYGDFQGPAVSHGQWVGEALAFIGGDWGEAREPNVLVFGGFASEQVMAYARRYRLGSVVDGGQLRERGIPPEAIDYLVVNQDVLRHPEEGRINRVLLRLAADRRAFQVAATFRSGRLPMVWVYRRAGPVEVPGPVRP